MDGQTDRQTDGRTEIRSQDRANIAASRGKNLTRDLQGEPIKTSQLWKVHFELIL